MKLFGVIKKSVLLADNRDHEILRAGRKALAENGFSEGDIAFYADRVIGVLNDYAAHFGEGKEIEYIFGKRFGRLEVNIFIPGEKYDLFEQGKDSGRRRFERIVNLNLNTHAPFIGYTYLMGRNTVTGYIPLNHDKRSFLRDPTLWGAVLGLLVGLICLHLPQEVNQFIINDVMDPVYKVFLKLLAGVMGPVIFIALVTSIISLDSINDLTNMGFKILRRCLRIIFFFIVVSICVSMLFFGHFGSGGIDFSPSQIVTMLLNIIPVNLISPFLENNTPQLVVLAFVAGLGLLILGDRTPDLGRILHQVNDWFMSVMRLVNRVMPVVPFLSIAIAIGKGETKVMMEGWQFILASYIIFTVCLLVKMVKTHLVTGMSSREILKKAKGPILTGFATQSTAVPMSQIYEITEEKLNIKKEFASFWIPMCSSMMAIKTTVNVVAATIMMTQMLGLPVSLSFLITLTILTTEISLASPGTVGSWVIVFEAFSIPTSYVGLFSTYRILTANYGTGVAIAYQILEEVEAAYKMGGLIDPKETEAPAREES